MINNVFYSKKVVIKQYFQNKSNAKVYTAQIYKLLFLYFIKLILQFYNLFLFLKKNN